LEAVLPSQTSRFELYRELAKSGIVALVLISVLGGYLLGQPLELPLDLARLGETLFGMLFLASGSSALNQWQEQETDSLMPRTAKRPIPSGRMSAEHALFFVIASVATGLVLLSMISASVALLGVAAVIFYNGFYTLWWKRQHPYAAIPGAVPGALPILMGYAASSGHAFAPGAIYLFFILFYWQMPHFWVLALRYRDDYKAGGIPTLPVARGAGITVYQISLWCLAYVGLALVAPLFLHVGVLYTVVALPLCAKLLWELRTFARGQDHSVGNRSWLRFFLWVNFSLIFLIGAAVLDAWRLKLFAPLIARF
jgi:protoheme IX farnesyltransferase